MQWSLLANLEVFCLLCRPVLGRLEGKSKKETIRSSLVGKVSDLLGNKKLYEYKISRPVAVRTLSRRSHVIAPEVRGYAQ